MVEIVAAPNGMAALATVLKYLMEVGQTPLKQVEALSHKLGLKAE
jgi:hypothetical protein